MTATPRRLEEHTVIHGGRQYKLVHLPSDALAQREHVVRTERSYLERAMIADPVTRERMIIGKLRQEKQQTLKAELGYPFLNRYLKVKHQEALTVTQEEIDAEFSRIELEHRRLKPIQTEIRKRKTAKDNLALKISKLDPDRQRKVVRRVLQKELDEAVREKYNIVNLMKKHREKYALELYVSEDAISEAIVMLLNHAENYLSNSN